MNPVSTSSIVFVTLSGLFWGGWIVGSQTPEGQEALAKAYASYASQQALSGHEQDIFAPNALRALVCGQGAGVEGQEAKPCLAVAAAGRLFIIDAGSGASLALERKGVNLGRLEAVLLTGADPVRAADLDEVWVSSAEQRGDKALPVYGPADSHDVVRGLNMALTAQGVTGGLQPWAPAPEPGKSVIVWEGDGLTISAFTTAEDAMNGRVGYRFDYRGRSLVVAGDRAEWASAASDAEVVMHGAQSQFLAQLHTPQAGPTPFEVAAAAKNHGAGTLVLTGVDPNPMIAEFQVNQAKKGGMNNVLAGKMGLLIEMPLSSQEVISRPL
jgi:ribonuclease Z